MHMLHICKGIYYAFDLFSSICTVLRTRSCQAYSMINFSYLLWGMSVNFIRFLALK